MATPLFVTDGVTEFEQSAMNRALLSDGTKTGVKVWHGNVLFNGAISTVNPGVDFAGLSPGGVTFGVGATTMELTLAGFTAPPVVLVSPTGGDSVYNVKVDSVTTTLAVVAFYDIDLGVRIITGAQDTNMSFNCIIIGV